MKAGILACACAPILVGCGDATPDRSTSSITVATANLVPWVAAESDGTTVTVYASLRTGTAEQPKPVALSGDDILALQVGRDIVFFDTFSQYSGTPFRASPVLRDYVTALADVVTYSAQVPLRNPEPVDVAVELRRAGVRGGASTMARVRISGPVDLTKGPPSTIHVGESMELCWETKRGTEALPQFTNQLATFGLCMFGSTVFNTGGDSVAAGCGTVDTSKVNFNDPSGCDATVYARETSRGEYPAPFRTAPRADGAPPYDDAPRAYSYKVGTTKILPKQ